MLHDVVQATYLGGYRIEVVFDNGRRGVVDFSDRVKRGGAYSRLRDPEFFKAFHIHEELGVLTWADEIDVAPETLYSEATGEPLPAWMDDAGEGAKAVGS